MIVIVSCSFFVRNGDFNQYLANQAVQSAREEEEMIQEVAPKIEPPSASMALLVQPGQVIQTLAAPPYHPTHQHPSLTHRYGALPGAVRECWSAYGRGRSGRSQFNAADRDPCEGMFPPYNPRTAGTSGSV